MSVELTAGQCLDGVETGPIAHGGHVVARVDGRVVFVRHALPDEVVDVRITEVNRRFARGDAVAVRRPSPHRIAAPCPIAAQCGGCDFQHVEPAFSRELKRRVVAELLDHQAGIAFTGQVREVQPAPFGWRTRMRYHLDSQGRPGMLGHRSGVVVPLPEEGCRIADPRIARPAPELVEGPTELVEGPVEGQLLAVAARSGVRFGTESKPGETVTEHAAGHDYTVALDGFWQAHAGAADLLIEEVIGALEPRPGETAFDLFCGVGLFAAALADAGTAVWGIEGDRRAVELARANVPAGRFFAGDVTARLGRLPKRADLVVLDPPRAGAGAKLITAIAARDPRRIAYVACDPAALARDLKTAAALGYSTTEVRAYDLFPTTHHVECLAILEPS